MSSETPSPKTELPAQEAAIRARLAEISKTPWMVDKSGPAYRGYVYCDDALGSAVAQCDLKYTVNIPSHQAEINAEFIAHAPDDISFLLSALSSQREGLERLAGERDALRCRFEEALGAAKSLTRVAEQAIAEYKSAGDRGLVFMSEKFVAQGVADAKSKEADAEIEKLTLLLSETPTLAEEYWCGCTLHAAWSRCNAHEDFEHDEEPPKQKPENSNV